MPEFPFYWTRVTREYLHGKFQKRCGRGVLEINFQIPRQSLRKDLADLVADDALNGDMELDGVMKVEPYKITLEGAHLLGKGSVELGLVTSSQLSPRHKAILRLKNGSRFVLPVEIDEAGPTKGRWTRGLLTGYSAMLKENENGTVIYFILPSAP